MKLILQIPRPPFWIDIYLFLNNGFVSCKIYDKRDDFAVFDIVNSPFLDGDVPRRPSYARSVYFSAFEIDRVCSHVDELNARNKFLTTKLLKQSFFKFCR